MAKICENCGFMAEDDFHSCPMCGAVLPKSVVSPSPMMNSSSEGYASTNLKSRAVAGLLGILLGAFGVHNFYLGYTAKGFIQILVTIFTFGMGGVWGLLKVL